MGLQLILVMETNRQCKSDWIYIKETIDHFYKYDISHVRFSPVFMDGKGKYESKEKSVKKLISQYSSVSSQNRTEVIYCFDTDKYDTSQEDRSFFETVRSFCAKRNYHFVWFCQDIEQVYLGNSVENSKKCIESASFKRKNLIREMDPAKLSSRNIRKNTSNIMQVLDQYLTRKQQ